MHGYGVNADNMSLIAKNLALHGYEVFAIDMRGHGDSGGPRGIFESRQ